MQASPIARLKLKRREQRERRMARRDRRILEATMKYQGNFVNIEVIDVSESGAYVIAPVLPEFADCVTLAIGLPEVGSSVMVSGRVRRVGLGSRALRQRGGIGIEFTRYYTATGRDCLKRHLAA